MIITARSFLLPSVVAHVLAAVLLVVALWSAPTFKVAKQQMIRVNLTQAAARPMRVTPPAAAPAQAAPPKPAPPKPTPPKLPPPKLPPPKLPPPKLPPPTPTIKPVTPPKRTVMPVPEKVVARQKKWEAEQKRKLIAKAAATNTPPKIVKRPPPRKIEIADNTPRVNTAFEEARRRFEDFENKRTTPATPAQPTAAQPALVAPQDSPGEQSAIIDNFFCNGIRTAIDRVWRQPPRILGTCEVTFRLTSAGRISDVRVSKAGPSELNKSALEAVQNAQFPPFPANLNREYLDLEVPFEILGTE